MTNPDPGPDERSRLEALTRYSILDTLPEQIYEDVAALASLVFSTPIALVTLLDADRQWFKAQVGTELQQTPRSVSFCEHTLISARTLIVPDATQDTRFEDNPAVVGEPNMRFYAGAPIVDAGGHVLGTVCVIDKVPRTPTVIQIAALEALARHVMALLECRRTSPPVV